MSDAAEDLEHKLEFEKSRSRKLSADLADALASITKLTARAELAEAREEAERLRSEIANLKAPAKAAKAPSQVNRLREEVRRDWFSGDTAKADEAPNLTPRESSKTAPHYWVRVVDDDDNVQAEERWWSGEFPAETVRVGSLVVALDRMITPGDAFTASTAWPGRWFAIRGTCGDSRCTFEFTREELQEVAPE